jgi:HK97 family phage prohead protease
MLHKSFGLDVKAVTDEGVIEGYASVFGGAPDSYGDIIAPGAFANTLGEHKRAGTMPLMLWGHDASQPPIGNWTDMAEDGKGLWVQGSVDLEDPMGQRVYRGLKNKRMKGLSIGYEARDSEQDNKRGVRILKDVKLWEVSPVNFPAHPRAAVDTVKSAFAAGFSLRCPNSRSSCARQVSRRARPPRLRGRACRTCSGVSPAGTRTLANFCELSGPSAQLNSKGKEHVRRDQIGRRAGGRDQGRV